jgi:hypothetical protein
MNFDWKTFGTLDRVIAGGGLLAFIALLLPWYGVSIGPFSASVDGWSAGFTAWAGGLLLTAAGVLAVLRGSGANVATGRVGPQLLIAGIASLGLLLVIIRWVSFPRYNGGSGLSYDVGARYGIYLALIAGIAEVAAGVMALRASGEQLPWAQAEHQPAQAEPEAAPEQAAPEPEPEAPATPEE